MRIRFLAGLIVSAFLSACSGGGGVNQSVFPAVPSGGHAPGPQSVVNTTNPYYLPLAPGNTWKFNDGVTFVDLGQVTNMPCDAGDPYEQIAVYTGGQTTTPAWSMYFIPGSPIMTGGVVSGHTGATLVAIAGRPGNDCYQDPRNPGWLTVPSDVAKVGDTYTCGAGPPSGCLTGAPETAAITAVGGTMQIASGTIDTIDTEIDSSMGTFGAGSNQQITWSFAKGVGFTSYRDGTYDLTLQSFSLSASCLAQP